MQAQESVRGIQEGWIQDRRVPEGEGKQCVPQFPSLELS